MLNEDLNKKTSKLTLTSLFKFDNKDLSDPRQTAEQFCIYFTNISSSLARNIPASLNHSVDFIDSLYFDEISEHEVVSIYNTLRSEKAIGFDNISTSVIKETITIDSYLSLKSLSSKVFLAELKIARDASLFKTGD